jgi:hypothetical protein
MRRQPAERSQNDAIFAKRAASEFALIIAIRRATSVDGSVIHVTGPLGMLKILQVCCENLLTT